MESNEKRLMKFLSELQSYSGQKILTFRSGGYSTTTAINSKPNYFEREFFLGRLQNPAYILDESEKIIAQTEKLFRFTSSAGWHQANKIELEDFLEHYTFLDMDIKNLKTDEKITPQRTGMSIGIPAPTGISIGGSSHYDENPYRILKVGDKEVDEFLQNRTLYVHTEVEIPKI